MSDIEKIWTKVLKEDEQQSLVEWWQWLHGEKQKGIRAELKRCGTLQEVMSKKGFVRLTQYLPRLEKHNAEGLLIVAAILAVLEIPNDHALPRLLGANGGSDKPVFSELRFQRLLASSDTEGFFHGLRRALIQVGKQANPILLADTILHWYQEQQHPDWAKGKYKWQYQWASQYYGEIFKDQKGAKA